MTDRADQIKIMEDNLHLLDDDLKGQIEATLKLAETLGDQLPDLVISATYEQVAPVLTAAMKEIKSERLIKDKAKELFVAGFEDTPDDIKLIQTQFVKLIKEDGTIQLIDYEGVSAGQLVGYLHKMLKELKDKCLVEAETLINPPTVKVPKKKTSGGTRRKAGEADEWFKNTVEDAQAQYKAGVWASALDIEAKTTFKEQMNIYKAGATDPRDDTRTLDKDLVKYQYKAVTRSDNIQDEEDSNRCRGAVTFKAARYGSAYAAKKNFKGAVMAQCSATGKDGYCAKCAVKKVDYFNTDNKYKKADISWSQAWVDEGVFQKIE